MTIQFGFSPLAGPYKDDLNGWHKDLETLLPKLAGHFKGLWMTDHFMWGDEPTYEAMMVLGYLAGKYPGWDIGPIVLGQSYRNPAMLAKMAATLQTISEGRFIMGIGAGWKEDEYLAFGYDYPRPGIRIEQLEDTIQIMQKLWTQPGKVTFEGKHYRVVDAYCEPKPDPVPPLLVGGGGEKTMLLAAKYADWWNLPDANPVKYKERLDVLKVQCEKAGRDHTTLRKSWFGRISVGRTEADALSLGKREAPKRFSAGFTRDNALVGSPVQLVEQIQAFAALGCEYFMVDILGLPDDDILGMLLEEVLPKVG